MDITLRNKIKESILFYYSLFLVALLLATTQIDNQYLLYVLIGGCVLLFLNPVYIIPVYFISSLANTYFIAGEGVGSGRIIGIILIISGLIYLVRHPQQLNKKNLYYILFISVFSFLSSSFSLSQSYHTFLLFMQYFAVVILLGQFRNVDLEALTKLLVVSSILTILVLGFTLKENLISIQVQRLSTSDDVNANRFAMMVAQLSAVTFAAFLIFKKYKIIEVSFLLIILLAYFMLILSGSRSATIGITFAIALTLFFLFKKQAKRYIFPLLLIVIAGYFFINGLMQLDIPFINRFSIGGMESAGGSQVRLTTWKTLIPITLQNKPFFGYGFGAENVIVLAKKHGLDKTAHNFLIDMFLQIGIVGVTLFFSYFIYLVKKIKKYTTEPLIFIPILILLTALFNGIGETIFPEKLFWNGIALAWLYMNNLRQHKYHKYSPTRLTNE